jgi:hypothetical protein
MRFTNPSLCRAAVVRRAGASAELPADRVPPRRADRARGRLRGRARGASDDDNDNHDDNPDEWFLLVAAILKILLITLMVIDSYSRQARKGSFSVHREYTGSQEGVDAFLAMMRQLAGPKLLPRRPHRGEPWWW